MGLVTKIKKYNHNTVANAVNMAGYGWEKPNQRPTNVEMMVHTLPRCTLEKILKILEGDE